jgi:hypothetical protein
VPVTAWLLLLEEEGYFFTLTLEHLAALFELLLADLTRRQPLAQGLQCLITGLPRACEGTDRLGVGTPTGQPAHGPRAEVGGRGALYGNQPAQEAGPRIARHQEHRPDAAEGAAWADRQAGVLRAPLDPARNRPRQSQDGRRGHRVDAMSAVGEIRSTAPEAQKATSCRADVAASAIARLRVSPPRVPVTGENRQISRRMPADGVTVGVRRLSQECRWGKVSRLLSVVPPDQQTPPDAKQVPGTDEAIRKDRSRIGHVNDLRLCHGRSRPLELQHGASPRQDVAAPGRVLSVGKRQQEAVVDRLDGDRRPVFATALAPHVMDNGYEGRPVASPFQHHWIENTPVDSAQYPVQ